LLSELRIACGRNADSPKGRHQCTAAPGSGRAVRFEPKANVSTPAEFGIAKRDRLPLVKDLVAIALMRTLKAALDPNGILNPGKVL
jgi:FAD/FMN-containing dehydrogenase